MAQLYKFERYEIQKLLKSARRVIKHPSLHILLAPSTSSYGRLLIIIPRKIGNAPMRNKIRRRLKALFYQHELYKKGTDCVIILKKSERILNFSELKKILFMAFQVPIPIIPHG